MNMYYVVQVVYEYFVVFNFVGVGGFYDGFNYCFYLVIGYCYFQFYFWQEIDYIFCVMVQFGVVFLVIKVFYFCYCDFGNFMFGQCFVDVVEFEWFDYCYDYFYCLFFVFWCGGQCLNVVCVKLLWFVWVVGVSSIFVFEWFVCVGCMGLFLWSIL